jgi:hypothetical protein
MAEVVKQFEAPVEGPDGRAFLTRACARPTQDGRWEGWLEFEPAAGSHILRTPRETTQPNRDAVAYWAGGLGTVYLQGALARALRPERIVTEEVLPTPAYDGPAPDAVAERASPNTPRPILDPFEVYAQGESVLQQELSALDPSHLRTLVHAFALVPEHSPDLATMSRSELAELIVAAVRKG